LEDASGNEMGGKSYVKGGKDVGGGFKCKGGKMGIKVSNVNKGAKTLDKGVK
jgi:hypothetical protein